MDIGDGWLLSLDFGRAVTTPLYMRRPLLVTVPAGGPPRHGASERNLIIKEAFVNEYPSRSPGKWHQQVFA
jgi:hypothetical protein